MLLKDERHISLVIWINSDILLGKLKMPDNQQSNCVESMINKIKEAQGNFIVFTGTGVTLASIEAPQESPASWPGLLQSGVTKCINLGLISHREARILRLLIRTNCPHHLIHSAEVITNALQLQTQGWLQETVGSLKVCDNSLINAIHSLDTPIVTLNYDDTIQGATKHPVLTWKDDGQISEMLTTSERFLWHLHGHWDSPESIILNYKSYHEITKKKGSQALIRTFFHTKQLLFIGCAGTFDDPNFELLLQWCDEVINGSRKTHYILCRDRDLDSLNLKFNNRTYLKPIAYGNDYPQLAPFIQNLAERIKPNASKTETISKKHLTVLDLWGELQKE